ncbi:DNA primase [Amylibacter kogurei]|uniref:DNA primase n=1 Tax=Paramylibacter kogurei TaxID=1889778 RepID=A0A2G5K4G0_9RHOB|nr:DNA primase [Amylibacter kogurei]PIB24411.1 DNA primase [Amylibacter kogurei]
MSLPPGFVEELRNRLSLSDVVGRKVMWESKKTNAAKGDYWAPCPFHTEKTASFHVDDRKGFYYCFGCHQKGDAITFVRETENVGFIEAIEILAREAGMPMPARDPKAQEKYDRNKVLAGVMEQAVQYFRLQLNTGAGAAARDYINGRGLSGEIQTRFEMGYAPNDRAALTKHLLDKGAKIDEIVECGMAIKPDDGGHPYDRFRGRIMFPIRNAQGACTAFGGRAMDPNARAKYLNSNETPLFDKGKSLYNHAPAREAAGKADCLIVAEGYMDVIALAQFGFNHAVAPLGTAITADQLALMWRIHPEPIIALDGDKAGMNAAMRLIDLALPLLEAGKSLRFCILPEGLDPDDLLKASGAEAMQDVLDGAKPMVDLLWQRETEGKVFDSPERRAALDASLRNAIKTIQDRSIRNHYGAAIKDLRATLFAPKNAGTNRPWQPNWKPGTARKPFNAPALAGTKSTLLAQADQGMARLRESVILAAAMRNPFAAQKFETALERCPISTPDLHEIQNALLAKLHIELSNDNASDTLISAMSEQLGYNPIERLFTLKPVREHPYLKANTNPDFSERTLKEELDKHAALIGSAHEIKEAEQDLQGLADEGITWRIQQSTQAREKAIRAEDEDQGSSNENTQELKNQLQKMLDDEIWVKKKR